MERWIKLSNHDLDQSRDQDQEGIKGRGSRQNGRLEPELGSPRGGPWGPATGGEEGASEREGRRWPLATSGRERERVS